MLIIDELLQVSVTDVVSTMGTLLVAYGLALPIAWDREVHSRSAGLRTFPLVAMSSCGYLIIAQMAFVDAPGADARILQGLVAGIGFLGGGAILKSDGMVKGTATAASIWSTAAVGAGVAYQRVDIAIAISLMIFLTLRLMTPVKERFNNSGESELDSGGSDVGDDERSGDGDGFAEDDEGRR